MFEVEWRMMYEAPVDKPVLIWVAPLDIPSANPAGRFEVGVVSATDPRSGKVSSKYAQNCRWTSLPRAPRNRVRKDGAV